MLTLEEAIHLHTELHKNDTKFNGFSIAIHLPEIADMIKNSNIETLLDYGCGKAKGWYRGKYAHVIGIKPENVYLYDPCVPDVNTYPTKQFDIVTCTDVMEHVPEDGIPTVLTNIFSLAKKAAFITIATRPAKKMLTPEINAHLTVKPPEWWREQINTYNTTGKYCKVRFDVD